MSLETLLASPCPRPVYLRSGCVWRVRGCGLTEDENENRTQRYSWGARDVTGAGGRSVTTVLCHPYKPAQASRVSHSQVSACGVPETQ